jgi:hypothetical protein
VLTNYVGELAQHDSSHHVWAPLVDTEWPLITTIDDHSRRILYGDLWEKETSWAHIIAVKTVVLEFGCPLKYYPDNHSIFRYVEKRDSVWKKFETTEEEAFVQWKEVLKDLNIEVTYALSSQAKGKVERPYQWLQDHLVRTCVREKITKIEQAREVLYQELHLYNHKWVHSTIKEIPVIRYEKALEEKRTLFRKATIKAPYETWDDIFCYRYKRIVDGYRKISFDNLQFSISGVPIRGEVELRISFDPKTKMAKIRFWYHNRLVGEQIVKAENLKKVHF